MIDDINVDISNVNKIDFDVDVDNLIVNGINVGVAVDIGGLRHVLHQFSLHKFTLIYIIQTHVDLPI